jgi:hypothetical protein
LAGFSKRLTSYQTMITCVVLEVVGSSPTRGAPRQVPSL